MSRIKDKNRIEETVQKLEERGEKAFITYMMAGLPDMETTKAIIRAQEEAGVDIVELGIPFSDPIADGPVIQNAGYQSIKKGTNVKKCFQMMVELRKDCQVPIVFMMYYNTILYYGLNEFAKMCAQTGVDGLIVPDLPLEEQDELQAALADVTDAPILIQLVSPVSKQRIAKILEHARGFVYCVSSMGVTGQAAEFHRSITEYLEQVKAEAKIPLMMGFGIQTAADVKPYLETIDGAIVGSYFVKLLEKTKYDLDAVKEYISGFKKGLK